MVSDTGRITAGWKGVGVVNSGGRMNHGSLFSGIGGFDLAAEWMGWNNIFHCEWNDFGQKVLKYYWPNAISYGDITKTDFSVHRGRIDIITGGFPCQPFSAAGKRKGKEDDRYLWPEMLRAIREIQPTWVIGENVGGIISMVQPGSEIEVESQATFFETNNKETILEQEYVIETICSDLEREGYSVQPILIPACGIGAPHRRDRVWFIANSVNGRYRTNGGKDGETNSLQGVNREALCSGLSIGTNSGVTPDTRLFRQKIGQLDSVGTDELCKEWITSDTKCESFKSEIERRGGECGCGRTQVGQEYSAVSECGIITDTGNQGLQGRKLSESSNQGGNECRREDKGQSYKSTTKLHKVSNWEQFPTQPPVCSRNDGISSRLVGITISKHRNESIKAYGNAIVPQVAFELFKAIEKIEDENTKPL